MKDILEYPYKAKPLQMVAAIAFFVACAVGMAYAAITNDRGLILDRIVSLSVEGATLFYWGVSTVAALFVVGGASALAAGLIKPAFIRLTPTELCAPSGLFASRRTTIALHDISGTEIQTVQKQRFITVFYRKGRLRVAESMLPAGAFEVLYAALNARVADRRDGWTGT